MCTSPRSVPLPCSHDLEICGFGGTARTLIVVNGRTGTKLFQVFGSHAGTQQSLQRSAVTSRRHALIVQVPFPSTVWSVTSHTNAAGSVNIAVGGVHPLCAVLIMSAAPESAFALLRRRAVEFELPVGRETYAIHLAKDSLCYTNGRSAYMYGGGGTQYSWTDMPSFNVMVELISTLISDEETLLRCIRTIVSRYPAVVNLTNSMKDPERGTSLMQWVIEYCSSSRLLGVLLQANCAIGIVDDHEGRNGFTTAIEQGKWAHMRLLLSA
eukprot:4324785-Prymnesium_polylepis.2